MHRRWYKLLNAEEKRAYECIRVACGCSCIGLTILLLWLGVLFITPIVYLQNMYIPALNQTLNSPQNTTLYFQLALLNFNGISGLYYDPINVTFFDGPNCSHFLANYTVPEFFQGALSNDYNTATKDGEVDTLGLDREAVFREVSTNGWTVFRVDVATHVRYKTLVWTSKRYHINIGANFKVNDQGTVYHNEKNLLKSNQGGQDPVPFLGRWGFWLSFLWSNGLHCDIN